MVSCLQCAHRVRVVESACMSCLAFLVVDEVGFGLTRFGTQELELNVQFLQETRVPPKKDAIVSSFPNLAQLQLSI